MRKTILPLGQRGLYVRLKMAWNKTTCSTKSMNNITVKVMWDWIYIEYRPILSTGRNCQLYFVNSCLPKLTTKTYLHVTTPFVYHSSLLDIFSKGKQELRPMAARRCYAWVTEVSTHGNCRLKFPHTSFFSVPGYWSVSLLGHNRQQMLLACFSLCHDRWGYHSGFKQNLKESTFF